MPITARASSETARDYARSNASIHFTKEFLALGSIDAVYEALETGDLDVQAVAADIARERQLLGVLLTLDPLITRLKPDETSSNEITVITPSHGLPLRYIARITPIGLRDEELLADHGLT